MPKLYGGYPVELSQVDDTIELCLNYPGIDDNPGKVSVEFCTTRVIADLLIHFDFPTNEWVIQLEQVKTDAEGNQDLVPGPEIRIPNEVEA